MDATIFPKLEIPQTIAAGPGPGATADRVLQAYASAGLADHMQADVLRGMIECKQMLRAMMGTENIHTFGVAGTGWSGLDCMFSAVQPGDTVVSFVNGTFSGLDDLTIRMKAATAEELAANSINPTAATVHTIQVPHGQSVSKDVINAALEEHKPKWAFMAHYETGSGRVNDLQAFNDACLAHGAMGLIDAVSSLGIADLRIDDFPGVVGWASCPQKGMLCLPLTYAPVSLSAKYMEALHAGGARSFVHHPVMEARHWGIIDGQDVAAGTYHRTHSAYAVAAFHEALRMILERGVSRIAEDYVHHEAALRGALVAMDCDVTSNMPSLVVLNLPGALAGREKELVQGCRAEGFGIWPTLSEPVQVRIGILNLLSEANIRDIVTRFGAALERMGADVDMAKVTAGLDDHYAVAAAA